MNQPEKQYWKKYYEDEKNVCSNDLQKNIGRTKGGVSISNELWNKTINDIENLLSINESLEVVELCCGNGQIIGNIAPKCKRAIGVDYSNSLLMQMSDRFNGLVKSLHSDVMEVSFDKESIDVVIIYFALQHFGEKETIQIVNKSLNWLRKGGKLFIGDIPNELKKWKYINQPEYRKDYLLRVLNDKPMIGHWYQPEFFSALSSYFSDISVKIIEQPNYHINSSYRFDVLIEKKK